MVNKGLAATADGADGDVEIQCLPGTRRDTGDAGPIDGLPSDRGRTAVSTCRSRDISQSRRDRVTETQAGQCGCASVTQDDRIAQDVASIDRAGAVRITDPCNSLFGIQRASECGLTSYRNIGRLIAVVGIAIAVGRFRNRLVGIHRALIADHHAFRSTCIDGDSEFNSDLCVGCHGADCDIYLTDRCADAGGCAARGGHRATDIGGVGRNRIGEHHVVYGVATGVDQRDGVFQDITRIGNARGCSVIYRNGYGLGCVNRCADDGSDRSARACRVVVQCPVGAIRAGTAIIGSTSGTR